jgi:hypothetical protein
MFDFIINFSVLKQYIAVTAFNRFSKWYLNKLTCAHSEGIAFQVFCAVSKLYDVIILNNKSKRNVIDSSVDIYLFAG